MTTAIPESVLHPASLVGELKKNNVSHVVWLPDSETNFLYHMMMEEPSIDLVPVCREGETMAVAAGLWVGGANPVVLIQNTGVFEAGDSIRGLCLDLNQPLVMLVATGAGRGAAPRPTRPAASLNTSCTPGASTTTWWKRTRTPTASASPTRNRSGSTARWRC